VAQCRRNLEGNTSSAKVLNTLQRLFPCPLDATEGIMRFRIRSIQADGNGFQACVGQLLCYFKRDESAIRAHHRGQTYAARVSHKIEDVRTHQRFASIQNKKTRSSFSDLTD
jgi:hypothetical protein